MVRNYKRKTTRGDYGNEKLTAALDAVRNGVPLIRVSKESGIPARTLRRHRDGATTAPGTSKLGRHAPVLPTAVEMELCQHIQFMEKALYGLTPIDVRRLAYDVAEAARVSHPFSKNIGMAGKD